MNTAMSQHVHIPCIKKSTFLERSIYRKTGQYHLQYWFVNGTVLSQASPNDGAGSSGFGRQLALRFHASLSDEGCFGTAAVSFGWTYPVTRPSGVQNFFTSQFPPFTRIYLESIRLKLILSNLDCIGKVRISLIRAARPSGMSTTGRLDFWNRYIDEPQNLQYWKVLYQKIITLDKPRNDDNVEEKVTTITLPINRVFETSTRSNAASWQNWEPSGINWNEFTYVVINGVTNNLSETDTTALMSCFFTAKFYELNAL